MRAAAAMRSSVLDVPPRAAPGALVVAVIGACAAHGLALGAAAYAGAHRVQQDASALRSVPELAVELLQPAPAPSPEPAAAAPPLTAARPAKARSAAQPQPKTASPPSAAASAKVVAADAQAVDFGDTFVMGGAASYAGGVSANEGTAKQPVHDDRARAGGVAAGTGNDLNADASRPPTLASGLHWNCPFPVEADEAGIDSAVVSLRVEVAADGAVREARATSDPGHGFAREARRCASSKRWAPARDRAGRPSAGVAMVNVRFQR